MSICIVESCESTASRRKMCNRHYRQWMKYDDPTYRKYPLRFNGDGRNYITAPRVHGRKHLHVVVAERALGRELPKGVIVHHVNYDRSDNRPENLVICPTQAYHKLLHKRTDALNACGDANKRKCGFCKQYDDMKNLSENCRGAVYHKRCAAQSMAGRYVKKEKRNVLSV